VKCTSRDLNTQCLVLRDVTKLVGSRISDVIASLTRRNPRISPHPRLDSVVHGTSLPHHVKLAFALPANLRPIDASHVWTNGRG
jgi:hypothetical protein